MTDSIDRPAGISGIRTTGPVTAASSARAPRNRRDDEEGFSYEDKVDIRPQRQIDNALEELDLSVAMIRSLLAGELPDEVAQALEDFAPLGDLSQAEAHCERVEQKQMDFVTWPVTLTLAQALARAAS